MWLFTKYGFFSCVCAHQDYAAKSGKVLPDKDKIMIRARSWDHLDQLTFRFKSLRDCEIVTTEDTDYRYRIIVSKRIFEKIVKKLAAEIDYDNFKNACAEFDGSTEEWSPSGYLDALHCVWDRMYRIQEERMSRRETDKSYLR